MVRLKRKELDYLNLERHFDYEAHLPPAEGYSQDYYVYCVAKWCRRVQSGDIDFTPEGYCDFMWELDGYELPIFETE